MGMQAGHALSRLACRVEGRSLLTRKGSRYATHLLLTTFAKYLVNIKGFGKKIKLIGNKHRVLYTNKCVERSSFWK